MMHDAPGLSDGTLLDGRLSYAQPVDRYRTGIEPVLLAASVPIKPGERVVEAGTGAAAGLLALAARVERITALGLERDPAMAGIAAHNVAANGFAGIRIAEQDIGSWVAEAAYDHAFANPPWHGDDSSQSPLPGRRAAKVADRTLLRRWVAAMAAGLRRRGTLSLILPASSLSRAFEALIAADCAETTVQPLWPRHGKPARLVILRGVRGGGGPCRVMPGLVLHKADGRFTEEADAILRDGEGLPF